MANAGIKRVIVTGAGFSAPAQLPIQNRIIDKMTEESASDFLSGDLPQESVKFIKSYIMVGLFLLDNYAKNSYDYLADEYIKLNQMYPNDVYSHKMQLTYQQANDSHRHIHTVPQRVSFVRENYYSAVLLLKSKIRIAIKNEAICVNLEDIFTSFDKSVTSREHVHKYTYTQMDEIRYSIMRLFVYYFTKGVQDHSYKQDDYLNFIKYIKKRRGTNSVTLITTNWDTLLEKYFDLFNITYRYGFQRPYTSMENYSDKHNAEILLLKIHGSANWLKCLHCGAISIFQQNEAAVSLFEDEKQEKCVLCGAGESFSAPSLQPEIITPTMLKSFSSRLYSNLWGSSSSELSSATHIIFVGYSLPIADFDFRYMLQKNVSSNAKIDVVLYNDDDPSQTDSAGLKALLPEKRYRDLFPKNDIKFFYGGFKLYFS